MWKTLRQIARVGIITETPAPVDETLRVRDELQAQILAILGRAPVSYTHLYMRVELDHGRISAGRLRLYHSM